MSTTRSIRIYDILPSSISPTGVWFVQLDEDNPGEFRTSFRMDYDTWDHMGRPEELTLTIEPGDRLNGANALVNMVSKDPIRVYNEGGPASG